MIIDIKNNYKNQILNVWNKHKKDSFLNKPGNEYRKYPLAPDHIQKDALLIIGINPSFGNGAQISENDIMLIDEPIHFSNFESTEEALEIFSIYEKPAAKAQEFLKELENEIEKINQKVSDQILVKKEAHAKSKPYKEKLNKLQRPLKAYQDLVGAYLKELKQAIIDWEDLLQWFPEKQYSDVEGLCKMVELAEVKENDYSLTPGCYVGYSIQIDEDFDYKGRMKEIHGELAELNTEANDLMQQILNTGL